MKWRKVSPSERNSANKFREAQNTSRLEKTASKTSIMIELRKSEKREKVKLRIKTEP